MLLPELLQALLNESTLLANCIGQNPSSDADSFVVSQEISRVLWNPKVHYAFTRARHLSLP